MAEITVIHILVHFAHPDCAAVSLLRGVLHCRLTRACVL